MLEKDPGSVGATIERSYDDKGRLVNETFSPTSGWSEEDIASTSYVETIYEYAN